MINIVLVRF